MSRPAQRFTTHRWKLRRWRLGANMKITHVAALIGCSRTTYLYWETAHTKAIPVTAIEKLSVLSGLTKDEICEIGENPHDEDIKRADKIIAKKARQQVAQFYADE